MRSQFHGHLNFKSKRRIELYTKVCSGVCTCVNGICPLCECTHVDDLIPYKYIVLLFKCNQRKKSAEDDNKSRRTENHPSGTTQAPHRGYHMGASWRMTMIAGARRIIQAELHERHSGDTTWAPRGGWQWYRSGTVNSKTVNSKFHLIRSFCEIFARFLSFHV